MYRVWLQVHTAGRPGVTSPSPRTPQCILEPPSPRTPQCIPETPSPQAHLRRHMEIHDRVDNYNPRQRKLRNLVIEDEKMVVVALQPPAELEVGSAEVIVESLAQGGLASQLPGQRLCAEEGFASPGVMEPSLLITAAIPEDCDT